MNKEKYFSETTLIDNPIKKLKLKLRKGSVTTDKIADGAVTADKLSDGIVEDIANRIPGTGTGGVVLPLTEKDINNIMNEK